MESSFIISGMKVALAIPPNGKHPSGLGTYTKNLVAALREFSDEKMTLRLVGHDHAQALSTADRLWWENIGLPVRLLRERIDLLHIPAFATPGLRLWPIVMTVHDLIGMRFPNQVGPASRFYWSRWLPWCARRADLLIADSEHTRRDIEALLKIPADRIRVIYPSGHEEFQSQYVPEALDALKATLGIREAYFLFVGTIEPRKNLRRVIQAFHEFLSRRAERNSKYQLVIVGSQRFARGKVYDELLQQFVLDSARIVFTGYLSRKDLNLLYNGAIALVFPSLYEGFGIPVLEAMGAGTAVITSKTTSLPEVAGDAGLLVDPEDVGEILGAMESLVENPSLRSSLIEKGKKRLKLFSWKRTAEQTLAVYREFIPKRNHSGG